MTCACPLSHRHTHLHMQAHVHGCAMLLHPATLGPAQLSTGHDALPSHRRVRMHASRLTSTS